MRVKDVRRTIRMNTGCRERGTGTERISNRYEPHALWPFDYIGAIATQIPKPLAAYYEDHKRPSSAKKYRATHFPG